MTDLSFYFTDINMATIRKTHFYFENQNLKIK
jgi:hypothetical protein